VALDQHSEEAMSETTPEQLLRKLFPPMLATLASAAPKDEHNWRFELKYDGFRAVAAVVDGRVSLWSRNSLSLNARFPQVVESLSKIRKNVVLDGEIVALDERGIPRFQLIQRDEAVKTLYVAFDLIWVEGVDVRRRPLEERRELLETLLRKPPKLVEVSQQTEGSAAEALSAAAREGHEGLIGKLKGSTYENRRSRNWIKLKAINVQELAIVGYTPSSHSDREIGALILGYYKDGHYHFAGKVGTGFSAKLRTEMVERLSRSASRDAMPKGAPRMRDATWVRPELVAQVQFTEWTSDGKLRHPSFLGLRPDKSPEETTREVAVPADAMKSSSAKKGSSKGSSKKSSAKNPTAKKAAVKPAAAAATKAKKKESAPAVVKMTNPDRLLYPRDKITKRDVADYFAAVSDAMIHTLRDRPLALEHWNQGISKPAWFHQNIGSEGPDWATYIETPTSTSRGSARHIVVDRPETLQWLAQMSALTLHMWSSRGASLDSPDWIVFDLDPAKGKGIEQAIETALVLRRLFEQLEIESIPKTSGKRGIHIFVPLRKGQSHEAAVDFGCSLGESLSKQLDWVTTERAIAARRGRLYFDCLQNGYGKTVVAPYSLRAIDGAPVSAPLKWSEVNKKLDPLKFNLRTMPDRLAKHGDLFAAAVKGKFVIPKHK
jgi:bifunctional non-homologous end joining protein LigD